jgi:hypothetical protein
MSEHPVKIAFASTNYGPMWRPVVETWLRCLAYTQRHLVREGLGEIAGVGITDRMYIHSADNTLVQDFLADESFTHLMHVESDMLLPDACIVDLLALDKPMASGIYFLRNGNGQPCLYRRTVSMPGNSYGMTPVSIYPQDRPFLLKGCPGLGCILFKREVFAQLDFPWFDLKENHYGSDLYFFTNALNKGIELWVDPRVQCGQIEYKVWTHDDYRQRILADPTFGAQGFIEGTLPPEDAA